MPQETPFIYQPEKTANAPSEGLSNQSHSIHRTVDNNTSLNLDDVEMTGPENVCRGYLDTTKQKDSNPYEVITKDVIRSHKLIEQDNKRVNQLEPNKEYMVKLHQFFKVRLDRATNKKEKLVVVRQFRDMRDEAMNEWGIKSASWRARVERLRMNRFYVPTIDCKSLIQSNNRDKSEELPLPQDTQPSTNQQWGIEEDKPKVDRDIQAAIETYNLTDEQASIIRLYEECYIGIMEVGNRNDPDSKLKRASVREKFNEGKKKLIENANEGFVWANACERLRYFGLTPSLKKNCSSLSTFEGYFYSYKNGKKELVASAVSYLQKLNENSSQNIDSKEMQQKEMVRGIISSLYTVTKKALVNCSNYQERSIKLMMFYEQQDRFRKKYGELGWDEVYQQLNKDGQIPNLEEAISMPSNGEQPKYYGEIPAPDGYNNAHNLGRTTVNPNSLEFTTTPQPNPGYSGMDFLDTRTIQPHTTHQPPSNLEHPVSMFEGVGNKCLDMTSATNKLNTAFSRLSIDAMDIIKGTTDHLQSGIPNPASNPPGYDPEMDLDLEYYLNTKQPNAGDSWNTFLQSQAPLPINREQQLTQPNAFQDVVLTSGHRPSIFEGVGDELLITGNPTNLLTDGLDLKLDPANILTHDPNLVPQWHEQVSSLVRYGDQLPSNDIVYTADSEHDSLLNIKPIGQGSDSNTAPKTMQSSDLRESIMRGIIDLDRTVKDASRSGLSNKEKEDAMRVFYKKNDEFFKRYGNNELRVEEIYEELFRDGTISNLSVLSATSEEQNPTGLENQYYPYAEESPAQYRILSPEGVVYTINSKQVDIINLQNSTYSSLRKARRPEEKRAIWDSYRLERSKIAGHDLRGFKSKVTELLAKKLMPSLTTISLSTIEDHPSFNLSVQDTRSVREEYKGLKYPELGQDTDTYNTELMGNGDIGSEGNNSDTQEDKGKEPEGIFIEPNEPSVKIVYEPSPEEKALIDLHVKARKDLDETNGSSKSAREKRADIRKKLDEDIAALANQNTTTLSALKHRARNLSRNGLMPSSRVYKRRAKPKN